ncbi:Serine/threonine-protein kinase PknD [uncultured archaeon]|nr:Serine/threonine-protein kinase PknD [uncultured archaeon]
MTKNGNIVVSSRYKVGRKIGQGCWGSVYEARDVDLEQNVAVKVLEPTEIAQKQMKKRNIDELRAVAKEAGKLEACSNVVPRRLEFDDNRTPFLVMPVYESFLSDELRDDWNVRPKLSKGLTLERVLGIAKDVAKGLYEMHSQIGRAHGDIKADNIAVDPHRKCLLNDLGTSTCINLLNLEKEGSGARGFVYTRAPECFSDDTPPTARSDVWGFGSLFYRTLTGEYILEREINESGSPEDFFAKNSSRQIDQLIRKKIRKAPRKMRGLLRSTLAYDPYKRLHDGSELEDAVEHTIDIATSSKSFWRKMKTVGVAALMLGLVGLTVTLANRHEPKDLRVPEVERKEYQEIRQYRGEMSLVSEGFSSRYKRFPYIEKGDLSMIKVSSGNNQNVAYFLKSYFEVVRGLHINRSLQLYNENQFSLFHAYSPPSSAGPRANTEYDIIAKNIEVALSRSRVDSSRVDLEDVCAIARVGEGVVNDARRATGSWDYSIYRNARDANGKSIIPPFDRVFIEHWITQVQQR